MIDKAWQESVRRFQSEAAGLLSLGIFDAEATNDLVVAAACGDEVAGGLIAALLEARKRVVAAPRNRPALCCGCPRPIRTITSDLVFGLAFPSVPRPESALSFAFCGRCAADRAGLVSKAENRLRKLWPGLRPVTVTHPHGGHG